MKTKVEIYKDQAGEYRWRLIHANGNIMAVSGEGYVKQDWAEKSVQHVSTYLNEIFSEEIPEVKLHPSLLKNPTHNHD